MFWTYGNNKCRLYLDCSHKIHGGNMETNQDFEGVTTFHFGPKHRKIKQHYKVKVNPEVRKITFMCLKRMKRFCVQQIKNGNSGASTTKNLERVILCADTAVVYLKKMPKMSNVRLSRFYTCLSRKQKEVLTKHNIKTLVDVSKITKQELIKLLRLGSGHPNPSFLITLGLSAKHN